MKLCQYVIDGTVIRDRGNSFNSTHLNGNPRVVSVGDNDSVPAGYEDISDIEGWDQWGAHIHSCECVNVEIKKLYDATIWSSLNANEKKACAHRFIASDSELTGFYTDRAEEDKSRKEFEKILKESRHTSYDLALSEIKFSFSSSDVSIVIGEIIDDNLEEKFVEHGIKTLFDYIKGENTYNSVGLLNKTFTIRNSATMQTVVDSVMSALEGGRIS